MLNVLNMTTFSEHCLLIKTVSKDYWNFVITVLIVCQCLCKFVFHFGLCLGKHLPSVLQGNTLPPLTLTEEQVGVVTQATASDPGLAFIATVTRYLQANSRPVIV